MQWYYSKNNIQLGPIEEHELRSKIASGEVTPADMVWREGMADWLPSAQVSELRASSLLSTPPVSGVGSPTVSQSPYQSPYSPPTSQPTPMYVGAPIPTYLWQSIVVTLFCCLPFGVVAIVYAAKVDSLKNSGDIAGAMRASSSAKNWCQISAVSYIGIAILGFLLSVVAGTIGD